MSQADQILRLLRGQRINKGWVSMWELNKIGFRYSARIMDLRKKGHEIESYHSTNGGWYYRLKPEVTK